MQFFRARHLLFKVQKCLEKKLCLFSKENGGEMAPLMNGSLKTGKSISRKKFLLEIVYFLFLDQCTFDSAHHLFMFLLIEHVKHAHEIRKISSRCLCKVVVRIKV